MPPRIPPSWLSAPATIAEIEAAEGQGPEPFGFLTARWETLKAQAQAGDEFRHFSSPPPSWRGLSGRQGVALVRDQRIVGVIVTMLN